LVTEEMKMKSILGMVAVLLFAVVLSTWPKHLGAEVTPDTEFKPPSIWEAKSNSRTWEVYQLSDSPHMSVDDKFRIQKDDDGIKLIPLFRLRHRWGQMDRTGFFVKLEQVEGKENYFCGFLDIHEKEKSLPHGFLIRLTEKEELEITWFDRSGTGTEGDTDQDSRAIKDCTNLQNHGGTAHAELN